MTYILFILKNNNLLLRFNKEYAYIINSIKKMFDKKSGKMIKIEFLGPIDFDTIELDIKNLQELSDFMLNNETLKEWVEISAVAVNDNLLSSRDYELKSGDRVSILPPVCGG